MHNLNRYYYSCESCKNIKTFTFNHNYNKDGELCMKCMCQDQQSFKAVIPEPRWSYFVKKQDTIDYFGSWNCLVTQANITQDCQIGYLSNITSDGRKIKTNKPRIVDAICHRNNNGGMFTDDIQIAANIFMDAHRGSIFVGFKDHYVIDQNGYATCKAIHIEHNVFNGQFDCSNARTILQIITDYKQRNKMMGRPFMMIYQHESFCSEYDERDLQYFCFPQCAPIVWFNHPDHLNIAKQDYIDNKIRKKHHECLKWKETTDFINYKIKELNLQLEKMKTKKVFSSNDELVFQSHEF